MPEDIEEILKALLDTNIRCWEIEPNEHSSKHAKLLNDKKNIRATLDYYLKERDS